MQAKALMNAKFRMPYWRTVLMIVDALLCNDQRLWNNDYWSAYESLLLPRAKLSPHNGLRICCKLHIQVHLRESGTIRIFWIDVLLNSRSLELDLRRRSTKTLWTTVLHDRSVLLSIASSMLLWHVLAASRSRWSLHATFFEVGHPAILGCMQHATPFLKSPNIF